LGWLVLADESKTNVQFIDRSGRNLTVHMRRTEPSRIETRTVSMPGPRPVQPDDPFELETPWGPSASVMFALLKAMSSWSTEETASRKALVN
jgi:hypothetical protein